MTAWIKGKLGMTVYHGFMGTKWDVEPVEVLKGRSPKSLVVWSVDDGYQAELKVGTTPVLYLHLWNGDYLTGFCQQNFPLANDSVALSSLRNRYARDAKE